MSHHPSSFPLLTICVLVTILIVFGMKYLTAARQAQARVAGEGAYRELAEKAEAAQTANAATQAALMVDVADMKGRLTAIEKVLREVE